MAEDPYGIVGHVLDGQFRVDTPIGEGGFSIVYRGHHVGLDEPVAIKCLKLQGQLGSAVVESFIRRFRDESKIHYRLSRGSLHIARTLAAGTTMAPFTGAIVPYMVLEWLDGFTLAAELAARRQRGEGGRPLREVIRLLDPVAEAMAYAHAHGVVHRDLSPSNVFVSHAKDGSVALKVIDFGVAKVISDHLLELNSRAVTVGQLRMFTPSYGAPEQFQESLGQVSPATDVHALALLIVELLIDRCPIEGDDLRQIAELVLNPTYRPTPRAFGVEVGDAVEEVMSQALRVSPAERPGDIGEFWGMLKNAVQRDRASAHESEPAAAPGPAFSSAPPAGPSINHFHLPSNHATRLGFGSEPPVASWPGPDVVTSEKRETERLGTKVSALADTQVSAVASPAQSDVVVTRPALSDIEILQTDRRVAYHPSSPPIDWRPAEVRPEERRSRTATPIKGKTSLPPTLPSTTPPLPGGPPSSVRWARSPVIIVVAAVAVAAFVLLAAFFFIRPP